MSLKLYIYGAVVLAALSLGVAQRFTIQNLEKEAVIAKANIATLVSSNESMSFQIATEKATIVEHTRLEQQTNEALSLLGQELQETNRTLNRYKDRQNIVFKKPGLVQIKEQKALDKFFEDTLK